MHGTHDNFAQHCWCSMTNSHFFSQPDFYKFFTWFDDASHFAKVKLYFYCWRFFVQLNNVRIRLLHNVNNCNSSVHIVVIGLLHYFKHRRALSSIPCDNTPSLRTTRCRAIAPLIISNSLYLRLSETIWLRLHLSFRCAKEVIRRIRWQQPHTTWCFAFIHHAVM